MGYERHNVAQLLINIANDLHERKPLRRSNIGILVRISIVCDSFHGENFINLTTQKPQDHSPADISDPVHWH